MSSVPPSSRKFGAYSVTSCSPPGNWEATTAAAATEILTRAG